MSALALTVGLLGVSASPAWAQTVAAPSVAATALPQGGQVVAGAASIQQSGASMSVTTATDRTAINWNSFSIGQNAAVAIKQPNANAITVNQVTGGAPSQIFGALSSNGRVVVTNPYGIWFGPSARVDVAGLVASTATASPAAIADFAQGQALRLDQAGQADASVVNDGRITVAEAGLAALVAPGVANNGVIVARLGTVQLGSANTAVVDFYGDGLVHFAVGDQITATPKGPDGRPLKAAVSNTGKLVAPGGHIAMTVGAVKAVVDQAINMSGIATVASVHGDGGDIVLDGGDGTTQVSGTLNASSQVGAGGLVQVTGHAVHLAATARVKASGARGGQVQIGGGPRGTGSLAHALGVDIASGALIEADGRAGAGGNIAVWSDGATQVAGTLIATGSTTGGLIETSGHDLDVSGISVHAGPGGQWLLDPDNLTIDQPLAATIASTLDAGTDVSIMVGSSGTPTITGTSTFTDAEDNPLGNGDICITSGITWTGGASLTLTAYRDIHVAANVGTSGTGSIAMTAMTGAFTLDSTSSITSGGDITLHAADGMSLNGTLNGTGGEGTAITLENDAGTLSVGGTIEANTLKIRALGTLTTADLSPISKVGTLDIDAADAGKSIDVFASDSGAGDLNISYTDLNTLASTAGTAAIAIGSTSTTSITFDSGGSLITGGNLSVTAGNVSLLGTLRIGFTGILQAADIIEDGGSDEGIPTLGTGSLTVSAGSITLGANITAGSVEFDTAYLSAICSPSITAASLTVNDTGEGGVHIVTAASSSASGFVLTDAEINALAGSVGTLTINANGNAIELGAGTFAGDAAFSGTAMLEGASFTVDGDAAPDINGTVTIDTSAANGSVKLGTINSTAGTGKLTVNAGTGPITLDGDITASTLALNGATTLAIDVTINAGSGVTIGSVNDNGTGQSLTINASGSAVTVGGTGGATGTIESLSVNNASSLTLRNLATRQAQDWHNVGNVILAGTDSAAGFRANSVTLAANSEIDTFATNSAVSLGSVDGAFGFIINAGSGNVSLGTVGGSSPLQSLSVTGGTLAVNNVTTTGDQTYNGTIQLTSAGAFKSTGGNLSFGGVIGTQDLTLSAGQDIFFNGDFGTEANRGVRDFTITTARNVTVDVNPATGVTYTLWVVDFNGQATGAMSFGDHSLETLGDVSIISASVDGRIVAPNTLSITTGSLTGTLTGGDVNVAANTIVGSTITATRSANIVASDSIVNTTIIAPTIDAEAGNSIINTTIIGGSASISAPSIQANIQTASLLIGGVNLGGGVLASLHSADNAGGGIAGSDDGSGSGDDKKKKKKGESDKDDKGGKNAKGASSQFGYAASYVDSLVGK